VASKRQSWAIKSPSAGHLQPVGDGPRLPCGKLRRSLSIATGVTYDERHRQTILHLLPRNISHPGWSPCNRFPIKLRVTLLQCSCMATNYRGKSS